MQQEERGPLQQAQRHGLHVCVENQQYKGEGEESVCAKRVLWSRVNRVCNWSRV